MNKNIRRIFHLGIILLAVGYLLLSAAEAPNVEVKYHTNQSVIIPNIQAEVKSFIYSNNISNNTYTENYSCGHYSQDLVIALNEEFPMLSAHVVLVNKIDEGFHAVVGIFYQNPQADVELLILYEPQTDEDVTFLYDLNRDGVIDYLLENELKIAYEWETNCLTYNGNITDFYGNDGLVLVDLGKE